MQACGCPEHHTQGRRGGGGGQQRATRSGASPGKRVQPSWHAYPSWERVQCRHATRRGSREVSKHKLGQQSFYAHALESRGTATPRCQAGVRTHHVTQDLRTDALQVTDWVGEGLLGEGVLRDTPLPWSIVPATPCTFALHSPALVLGAGVRRITAAWPTPSAPPRPLATPCTMPPSLRTPIQLNYASSRTWSSMPSGWHHQDIHLSSPHLNNK